MTDFDSAYEGPPPPWDIGRPQPAFVRLAAEGAIAGPVLDAGCGTGENALHLAGLGIEVIGLDAVPAAIAAARAKATRRELAVEFIVGDALALAHLSRTFATVVDCGLFHVFGDADRARYVAGLAAAVDAGGRIHILCFSDRQPGSWGPRRVTEAELRAAFADGWQVEAIQPERFETNNDGPPVEAWLATFVRRLP
jgi:SAM-dependent methyltransferase